MMWVTFIPIHDYFLSRKHLWRSYIISIIPPAIALAYTLVFNVRDGVNIEVVFSSFIDIQISAIAILISFSIAIITILVTSDNENIRNLKTTPASVKNYRPLKDGKNLNLFQVLLSGVTYNVLTQILYLAILVSEMFIQYIAAINTFKYFVAVNLFFLTHILLTLVDSVVNMYFVFWKDFSKSSIR